jgi:dimethylhistidine N-methyltransferase
MPKKNIAEKDADVSLASEDVFARDVIDGLSRPQKTLPCRYLYDDRGSDLFEQITELEEYYPTRTETAILADRAAELVKDLPADSVLIEFGSGSSRKTELLLDALPSGAAYVALDVSPAALKQAAARLAQRYPSLDIRPVVGDFSSPVKLPADLQARPKIGFFPGSTIGNLAPTQATGLLARFREMLSPHGRLIVGVDLKKDPATLIRAYNDDAGVTAAFNLNLLDRINREIEPVFDIDSFDHRAIYNAREGRVEMHLVSKRDQKFAVRGRRFTMQAGESIHTENSYKYTVDQFQALAQCAGWSGSQVWVDPEQRFSVHELAS